MCTNIRTFSKAVKCQNEKNLKRKRSNAWAKRPREDDKQKWKWFKSWRKWRKEDQVAVDDDYHVDDGDRRRRIKKNSRCEAKSAAGYTRQTSPVIITLDPEVWKRRTNEQMWGEEKMMDELQKRSTWKGKKGRKGRQTVTWTTEKHYGRMETFWVQENRERRSRARNGSGWTKNNKKKKSPSLFTGKQTNKQKNKMMMDDKRGEPEDGQVKLYKPNECEITEDAEQSRVGGQKG